MQHAVVGGRLHAPSNCLFDPPLPHHSHPPICPLIERWHPSRPGGVTHCHCRTAAAALLLLLLLLLLPVACRLLLLLLLLLLMLPMLLLLLLLLQLLLLPMWLLLLLPAAAAAAACCWCCCHCCWPPASHLQVLMIAMSPQSPAPSSTRPH
jgi:hypothetical protein